MAMAMNRLEPMIGAETTGRLQQSEPAGTTRKISLANGQHCYQTEDG
jgi:hypothetical protein